MEKRFRVSVALQIIVNLFPQTFHFEGSLRGIMKNTNII